MVQQKVVRNVVDRLNYISAKGPKYSKKQGEIQGTFSSNGENTEKYFKMLKNESTSTTSRVARHIIVPVPLKIRDEPQKQVAFAQKYIEKLFAGQPTLYTCAVHQVPSRKSDCGVQAHAHIIFSERPMLEKPITKHIKTRYYDQNGKECKKADSVKCVKAHDRVEHFGDKLKFLGDDGKKHEIFSSKNFCLICDEVWRETVKEMGLMTSLELRDNGLTGNKPISQKQKHLGEFDRVRSYPKARDSYIKRSIHQDIVKTKFNTMMAHGLTRASFDNANTQQAYNAVWREVESAMTKQRIEELKRELAEGEITREEYEEEMEITL